MRAVHATALLEDGADREQVKADLRELVDRKVALLGLTPVSHEFREWKANDAVHLAWIAWCERGDTHA